jgi:hypothetical protein
VPFPVISLFEGGPMGLLDRFFSKTVSREDFAKLVIKALEVRGASDIQFDPEDFSVRVGSLDNTLYLSNAFTDYAAVEKQERDAVILRYVASFTAPRTSPKTYAEALPNLMPVVRDPAYYALSSLMFRAKGGDPAKLKTSPIPIAEGLVGSIAIDSAETISYASDSTLNDWNVTLADAFPKALENLRDRSPFDALKQVAPGLFLGGWEDSYESARILLPDLLHRLNLNGDPLVFIPNRNELWVTGQYDMANIGAILKFADESHFSRGHSLSPNFYARANSAWKLHIPEDSAQRKQWEEIKYKREATDYEQQKSYLDAMFKLEKRDIFVAPYKVYRQDDGQLFSRSIWSNGVDTLLPKTDRVVLGIDAQKKIMREASWNSLTAIVGSLMELETDPAFYPVRYRVQKFPDEAQLAELSAAANN